MATYKAGGRLHDYALLHLADTRERRNRRTRRHRPTADCANILGPATSIYRWEGEIETAAEVIMFAKTTKEAAAAATAALRANHPYETPCVIAVPISDWGSHAPFLDWVKLQVDVG